MLLLVVSLDPSPQSGRPASSPGSFETARVSVLRAFVLAHRSTFDPSVNARPSSPPGVAYGALAKPSFGTRIQCNDSKPLINVRVPSEHPGRLLQRSCHPRQHQPCARNRYTSTYDMRISDDRIDTSGALGKARSEERRTLIVIRCNSNMIHERTVEGAMSDRGE
jgi:hypothetical protein